MQKSAICDKKNSDTYETKRSRCKYYYNVSVETRILHAL